jgi:hypothetical protein
MKICGPPEFWSFVFGVDTSICKNMFLYSAIYSHTHPPPSFAPFTSIYRVNNVLGSSFFTLHRRNSALNKNGTVLC